MQVAIVLCVLVDHVDCNRRLAADCVLLPVPGRLLPQTRAQATQAASCTCFFMLSNLLYFIYRYDPVQDFTI